MLGDTKKIVFTSILFVFKHQALLESIITFLSEQMKKEKKTNIEGMIEFSILFRC